MTKIKTIALFTFVIVSVAASLMIHARAETASQEKAALLQQQSQQLAALQTEHQRLSNLVERVTDAPVANHSAELAKLRAQAESLRQKTNTFSRQAQLRAQSKAVRAAASENHTPEYWQQFHQMAGTKHTEARDLVRFMTEYAQDHQKQYPTSLSQLAPYLAKNHITLSGTNRFEIVYQGSLAELDGIPWGSIALVRDSQVWLSPDGRPSRIYGMTGGTSRIVSSDDNFQSWEAEHVISGPASK